MAKTAKNPADNRALLTLVELVKPEDMSYAQWLAASDVNSSFITDLRKGVEPSVYKVERLARSAGMRLSELWRRVELVQFEIERRRADAAVEDAENAVSIHAGRRLPHASAARVGKSKKSA